MDTASKNDVLEGLREEDERASIDRLLLVRKGHAVKRCHTEPIIGENTVGQHSAGVAALLLEFTGGQASAELLKAAIYHDVSEARYGDMPATAKWLFDNGERDAMAEAERAFEEEVGLRANLSEQEKFLLHLADKMELMFFCYEQRLMGNTRVDIIFKRLVDRLEDLSAIERAPERAAAIHFYLMDNYPGNWHELDT